MSSWGISASRNKSHDDDGIMNQVKLINMRFSSSPSQWCNWRLKKCNFLLTVETRSMSRHNRLRSRFSWGHDNSQRKHVSLFPFCLLYDKFSLRAPQRSAIVFVVVVGHFSCSHSTMKKSPKRHKKSWNKISAWDTKKKAERISMKIFMKWNIFMCGERTQTRVRVWDWIAAQSLAERLLDACSILCTDWERSQTTGRWLAVACRKSLQSLRLHIECRTLGVKRNKKWKKVFKWNVMRRLCAASVMIMMCCCITTI